MDTKTEKKRILVVDDEQNILEILDSFLQYENFEVYTASNGREGLSKLKEILPDLVLLDIAMHNMDGIQTLTEMKKINPDVNVIMITAYRDAERIVESFRIGAYDCVFKPFDFKYLRQSIRAKLLE